MKSEFLTPHAKVLLAIARNSGMTTNEILRASGLAPNTFYKAKEQLVEDGLVQEVEQKNGRVKVKRLFLTPEGRRIANQLKTLEFLTKPMDEWIPSLKLKDEEDREEEDDGRMLNPMVKLLNIIEELEKVGGCAKLEDIVKRAGEENLQANVNIVLRKMRRSGLIYEYMPNCYRKL